MALGLRWLSEAIDRQFTGKVNFCCLDFIDHLGYIFLQNIGYLIPIIIPNTTQLNKITGRSLYKIEILRRSFQISE